MPCDVVARLLDALSADWRQRHPRAAVRVGVETGGALEPAHADLLTHVGDLLPCDGCRGAEITIAKLGRLGKLERRILLAASPPVAEAVVLEPLGPGRAAAEAHRRALHRLAELGLLRLGWPQGREEYDPVTQTWRRVYRRRTAQRTSLAQAVVDYVGAELRGGRRIRWAPHRAALLAAVERPVSELLGVFRDRVAARREGHLLVAALGRLPRRTSPPASEDPAAALDAILRAIDTALGVDGSISAAIETALPAAGIAR
jgi:hypothetical protein